MAKPSGIRWPEDMEAQIRQAMAEDDRTTLTDEVIHLVKLGLEERELRRVAVERDLARRRAGSDPQKESPCPNEGKSDPHSLVG